jgi:NAD(P)-dependent dehydrogenase (short-subunit alcohol dehydrogenase family)
LVSSAFFRIINVSSLAHKKLFGFGPEPKPDWENINFEKNYDPNVSYSRSKFYNVLFTKALAEKMGRRGLVAALHPGVVRTELMRELKGDGIKGQILKVLLVVVYPLWWLISKSSYEGAQTTLFTTLSDKVENGSYYSDCKPSEINSNATKENWNKLWEISEKTLGIKFEI